jgi:cathepsin L
MFSKILIIALAFVASAAAFPTFEEFAVLHEKVYSADEVSFRQQTYLSNVAKMTAQNAKASFNHGINKFSDWTLEEFHAWVGKETGVVHKIVRSREHNARLGNVADRGEAFSTELPDSVDWRDVKGVVTSVKNQGQCGSCWAFAATEALESAHFLKNNESVILAPQQYVSCAPNNENCGGVGGCEGSIAELAYDYLLETAPHGQVLESQYPYSADDSKCQAADMKPAAAISAYDIAIPNNYTDVMHYVAKKGPLSVTVDASTWSTYSSGIFNGCDNDSPDLNHLVQLVGYGTEDGTDYWLVRNSWGEDYGEDGYIRLQRNDQTKTGEFLCGIDTTPEDGSGCTNPPGPAAVATCGNCGILFDVVFPIAK